MSDIEIEIQAKIENSGALLDFLKKNAKLKNEKRQMDEYYSPTHRNFLDENPVKEWLRIRDEDGKYSMTYKNFHYDANGKGEFCDEYETKIGDLKKFRKILSALNFKMIVRVDKLRSSWIYGNYEISIDSIWGLGDFVEVEYKGLDGQDPRKIKSEMIDFLKGTGCGQIKTNQQGYPFLILFPEKAKYQIV